MAHDIFMDLCVPCSENHIKTLYRLIPHPDIILYRIPEYDHVLINHCQRSVKQRFRYLTDWLSVKEDLSFPLLTKP